MTEQLNAPADPSNPINSTNSTDPITLIGTVHLDIEAASNLYELLRPLRPACIAVEISAFSVRYRWRMEGRWLKRLAVLSERLPAASRDHVKLRLLRRQLSMPFEWVVAERYASENNILIIPVDSGEISRRELPCWNSKLLSEENLRFLVSTEDESLEAHFSDHYSKAHRLLRQPERISMAYYQLVFDESWCKREELLVRRVSNLSKRFRPLVYIGGWMHLINLPLQVTLASRLEKHRIKRFLITRNKAFKL